MFLNSLAAMETHCAGDERCLRPNLYKLPAQLSAWRTKQNKVFEGAEPRTLSQSLRPSQAAQSPMQPVDPHLQHSQNGKATSASHKSALQQQKG